MKADRIIKNAIIFTADKEKPLASALVVKDGKCSSMLAMRTDFRHMTERWKISTVNSLCPVLSTATSM